MGVAIQGQERPRERKGRRNVCGWTPAVQALGRVLRDPPPPPLDIAMDDLQAVQVPHSTKQPRADAGALGPEEGVRASLS